MNAKSRVKIEEKTYKISKIKTTRDEEEVNKLLSEGWELLNAGVIHTDNTGFQAKHAFILGRAE